MKAARDALKVRGMFDRIARGYDRANTVLSFGRDRSWRRRAADAAALQPGGAALDVACGTGQLTLQLKDRVGAGGPPVGLGFTRPLLGVPPPPHPVITFVHADATN